MGLPLPPRRFHGLEVFRSPACHVPKAVAPPPGLARFQGLSAGPVLDPKVRDCPSWGCSAPSTTLLSGPLHPGLPHLARSAREVFTSSTVCSLIASGSPRGPTPFVGFGVKTPCARPGFEGVATPEVWVVHPDGRVAASAGLRPHPVTRYASGARCAPSSSSEEPRGRGPLRHAVSRTVPWAGSLGPGDQEVVLTCPAIMWWKGCVGRSRRVAVPGCVSVTLRRSVVFRSVPLPGALSAVS